MGCYLQLDPADVAGASAVKYRDVTDIGHFGTGNAEITVETEDDIEAVKPFIAPSFRRVGGA